MSSDIEKRDSERNRRLIWRGVGHRSVREMAQDTGLSVQEVVALRNELFETADVITADQRRLKLILDLQETADRARSLVETVGDERAQAPLLTAATGAMKTVLAELARIEKNATGEQVTALNKLRRDEVRNVYNEAISPFLDWLEDQGYVDRDVSEPVAQEFILEAGKKMDERHES